MSSMNCASRSAVVLLLLGVHRLIAADAPPADLETLGEEARQVLQEIYAYDKTIPLEPRVVEKRERDGTVREKIVFRGAQGFLVPGYLELPSKGRRPCPCVLLLHGWSGSKEAWWQDGGYISGGNVRQALLVAGYAVLALDAQIHGDRIAQNDFAPVNHYVDSERDSSQRKGYFTQREIYIQTTRDYRRAIDYLETRAEIDSQRMGAFGYSMGGCQTFLLTGVEPRIKAAVACCTPADRSKLSPIAPQNFISGIGNRPFLMIMGRTDDMCPLDIARGLFKLIDSTQKDLIVIDAGHRLPVDYVPHATGWIGRHL